MYSSPPLLHEPNNRFLSVPPRLALNASRTFLFFFSFISARLEDVLTDARAAALQAQLGPLRGSNSIMSGDGLMVVVVGVGGGGGGRR